jgi:hypothetical protein
MCRRGGLPGARLPPALSGSGRGSDPESESEATHHGALCGGIPLIHSDHWDHRPCLEKDLASRARALKRQDRMGWDHMGRLGGECIPGSPWQHEPSRSPLPLPLAPPRGGSGWPHADSSPLRAPPPRVGPAHRHARHSPCRSTSFPGKVYSVSEALACGVPPELQSKRVTIDSSSWNQTENLRPLGDTAKRGLRAAGELVDVKVVWVVQSPADEPPVNLTCPPSSQTA